MNTDNQPLVSIVVITYNSSQFVLDTLESAKAQTYQNIELIVTDDCSTDRTVNLCNEWMEKNRDRFVRVEVITSPVNTGISSNCNRGFNAACGEWIKGIAGDDLLQAECIESFVSFVKTEKVYIATCGLNRFDNQLPTKFKKNLSPMIDGNALEQLKWCIKQISSSVISGPSLFVNKEKFLILGGFDLQYPMVEDYPLVMKFLINNFKIGVSKECLVNFRVHASSITHTAEKTLSTAFFESYKKASKDYPLKQAWRLHLYTYWWNRYVTLWILDSSHKNLGTKLIGYIMRLFDIVNWKKHFI